MTQYHKRSDVYLSQRWKKEGEEFEVVGICDEPTITLENIVTGQREHYIIEGRLFAQFKEVGA